MLELIKINFVEIGGWSLLLLSWGFIVFLIVKGVLVPKPFHDIVLKTLETERETRSKLQTLVESQNKALEAIAEGVETIKGMVGTKRDRRDHP
jgi:hypothetical protein